MIGRMLRLSRGGLDVQCRVPAVARLPRHPELYRGGEIHPSTLTV